MFGHKSFLRIGALGDSSISGLYKDSYELENCHFSFNQGTNTDGKPQTDVRGGTLYLTYAGLPQDDMLRWILNPKKYEDGAIVICDDSDEPLEKILFEQAAYIHTKIILQERKIKVGETTFENRWTINE